MKNFIKLTLAVLAAAMTLAAAAAEKSQKIVYIDGAKYYIHTVRSGETIYSLSKLYGVGEQVIVASNPSLSAGLKADQNIKIPVTGSVKPQASEKKLKRKFDMHYVESGETLYAISRKYEISVETILEDNPDIDPIHLAIGSRILIRKSEMGESSASQNMQQLEDYKDNLNSLSDSEYTFHLVHAGETLYALARRFETTEDEIIRINSLTDGLKTGTIIKLPAKSVLTDDGTDVGQPGSTLQQNSDGYADNSAEIFFESLGDNETLDVALLLPLSSGNSSRNYYVEFYEGFLLGLEDVKNAGKSVSLTLFDTSHDYNKTAEIVSDMRFRRSKLIVGPVYEDELLPVLQFAEQNSIPVVSPLAHIANTGSNVLFQMSPDPERKLDKLRRLIGENTHVTLIYTDRTDKEFEKEMMEMLGGRPYATYKYTYVHHSANSGGSDMTPLLQNGLDNVFIVMADNETEVDRILAAIASADSGLVTRGHTAPKFTVIGNPRWLRYNNIDRAMFFKDRVSMVSTYHAKRDSEAVRSFDSRFVEAFGALPSLYAYRGYDAAVIFCNGMYGDIQYKMEDRRYRPLQTAYKFSAADGFSTHVNQEWMRVDYKNDFTINAD